MPRVRLQAEALSHGRSRWRCERYRRRFGLLSGTPLAREYFNLQKIYALLYWFEFWLTDHDHSERGDVSYHRVHRFFHMVRRPIHDFEEPSIRLLDGEAWS